MKRLALLSLLLSALSGCSQQTSSDADHLSIVKALQKSINQRDYALIAPYLSADFTYKNMGEPMASHILKQVLTQFPRVDSIQVQSLRSTSDRYVCALILYTQKGIENKQLVLNQNQKILSADIAEISMGHSAENPPVTSGTTNAQIQEFSFQLSRTQHLIVEASVNGINGKFVVDSGYGGHLMLNKDFFTLEEAIADKAAFGVNGEVPGMGKTSAIEFKWGSILSSELSAETASLSHLGMAMGIENFGGIIGAGFYLDKVLAIDYQKRKLWISSQAEDILTYYPAADFTTVPLSMAFHLPIVECEINKEVYRMGLDIGAQGNMLAKTTYNKVASSIQEERTEQLLGADGKKETVTKAQVTNVLLDENKYTMDFVFGDLFGGSHQVTLMDGLLGHPFLSSQPIIIDFSKQQLILLK